MGRVKVQFHWQANPFAPQRANSDHSCWMRVMQRSAGAGMGQQFIPRIGQEVLVGFINNDMDQPFVLASLYNGQGEGGTPPTPGGQNHATDTSAFADSADHRPSAQTNRINSGTGGNSPAWHGAAAGAAQDGQAGQNNAAALSGIKSKELGGQGYNQLVLDEQDQSVRVSDQNGNSVTLSAAGITLDSPKDIVLRAKGSITLDAVGSIGLAAQADASTTAFNVRCEAQVAFSAKGAASAELSASGQTTIQGAMVMIN
jgi:uncharacterized protein involved in type VI secretion and phage assembly